jgi:2-methylisocitrate lyase-like PEP mutase family enzyme
VSTLAERAERLRRLHRRGDPLLLPNAWDAITARAVVAAGYPAVATTSAGVAHALGYDDHEGAPADEMLAAVERIVRSVDVPVTADLEAGYGLAPDVLVGALLDAGAVGLNLEDTDHATGRLTPATVQAERLAAVREAADIAGVDVVVNARIDVAVHTPDGAAVDPDELVARARAYADAGASCVYPILVTDPQALAAVVAAVDVPVNALLYPPAPSLAELRRIGIARVSLGSGVERAASAHVAHLLERLRDGAPPWAPNDVQ